MLDEVRRYSELLFSEDPETQWAAYLWLRDCGPFRNVVARFRQHHYTLFVVAALVAAENRHPLAPVVVALLNEEIDKQLRTPP